MRLALAPLLVPALALLGPVGCQEAAPADARFASPDATVRTLFRAYGVEQMEGEEVRGLLRARASFRLRDRDLYVSCFSDWSQDEDEGLAGFVFGRLVAAKDHLRFEGDSSGELGSRVRVIPIRAGEAGDPIVLIRRGEGWKLSLHESVPSDVRRQLYRIHREARRRERG